MDSNVSKTISIANWSLRESSSIRALNVFMQ
jgi:hypothetical protein